MTRLPSELLYKIRKLGHIDFRTTYSEALGLSYNLRFRDKFKKLFEKRNSFVYIGGSKRQGYIVIKTGPYVLYYQTDGYSRVSCHGTEIYSNGGSGPPILFENPEFIHISIK